MKEDTSENNKRNRYEGNLSIRQIAKVCGVSKSVVNGYLSIQLPSPIGKTQDAWPSNNLRTTCPDGLGFIAGSTE